ncbi:hypothetical protein BJY59DRAFT_696069 [Rhodotorula toruloides]
MKQGTADNAGGAGSEAGCMPRRMPQCSSESLRSGGACGRPLTLPPLSLPFAVPARAGSRCSLFSCDSELRKRCLGAVRHDPAPHTGSYASNSSQRSRVKLKPIEILRRLLGKQGGSASKELPAGCRKLEVWAGAMPQGQVCSQRCPATRRLPASSFGWSSLVSLQLV